MKGAQETVNLLNLKSTVGIKVLSRTLGTIIEPLSDLSNRSPAVVGASLSRSSS
jgi:hypothetical protein